MPPPLHCVTTATLDCAPPIQLAFDTPLSPLCRVCHGPSLRGRVGAHSQVRSPEKPNASLSCLGETGGSPGSGRAVDGVAVGRGAVPLSEGAPSALPAAADGRLVVRGYCDPAATLHWKSTACGLDAARENPRSFTTKSVHSPLKTFFGSDKLVTVLTRRRTRTRCEHGSGKSQLATNQATSQVLASLRQRACQTHVRRTRQRCGHRLSLRDPPSPAHGARRVPCTVLPVGR